jgi:hypothetical protein
MFRPPENSNSKEEPQVLIRNQLLFAVPLSASALLVASIQSALAQEALEEIIVTARMRAEPSEDAPVAIKAFTATEIE